tara:strand:- start:5067 stop:5315 length:249 start_codon:yes stop_codon:yes gene_type:complete
MKTRSGLNYNIQKKLGEKEYYIQLAKNFKIWKETINKICIKNISMCCDELPDIDYYSFYIEEVTPKEMYDTLVKNLYNYFLN